MFRRLGRFRESTRIGLAGIAMGILMVLSEWRGNMVQFASDTGSGAIAGVAVDNSGSGMGKMRRWAKRSANTTANGLASISPMAATPSWTTSRRRRKPA